MNITKINFASLAAVSAAIIFSIPVISNAAGVLDIGPGARSIALGRTFTSVQADGYGIFGNPASLTGLDSCEIVSMYGQLDEFSNYTMLGYAMPSRYGTFFAGYANNQINDLTATALDSVTGRPTAVSDFDFKNNLFILGYEQRFNKMISYGVRLKYANIGSPDIGNVSGWGLNADAGILAEASDKLTLGMSVANIIPCGAGALQLHNGETEEQPLSVNVGAGYYLYKQLVLYPELTCTKDMPVLAKMGVEWKPKDMFALRGGVEQMSSGWGSSYLNATVGAGFNVGPVGLDYAYYYDSLVGTNSRQFISLRIKMSGVCSSKAESKEKPAEISALLVSTKDESPKVEPAVAVAESSTVEPVAPLPQTFEDKIAIAEKISQKIANVYYKSNSDEFIPLCLPLAEMNADYLQRHPDLNLIIEVYGDRTGSEAATRAINEKRAARLREEYMRRNIASERITTRVHGQMPRAVSDETHDPARDRRAETKVIVNR